jgi:L-threonylcarbamoyladenylate synthase
VRTSVLSAVVADGPTDRAALAISEAARLLRAGEVVAFPTETVYGLGADAFNEDAVAKVFAAKGRPGDNPLIVHVATPDEAARCVQLNGRAWRLIDRLMPGPLTLVLPAQPSVPSIVRAGLPTVAVRMPDHPVASALIREAGPLVAPSANSSGRPSPTTARHVLDDLDGRIAAVLDAGPCRFGIESTIVDLTGAEVVILRAGSCDALQIAEALGEQVRSGSDETDRPRAPGMKYRHYAPRVPVTLIVGPDASDWRLPDDGAGRLVLATPDLAARLSSQHPGGAEIHPIEEPTVYARLRQAEDLGCAEVVILLEWAGAISPALLDRLRKASARG